MSRVASSDLTSVNRSVRGRGECVDEVLLIGRMAGGRVLTCPESLGPATTATDDNAGPGPHVRHGHEQSGHTSCAPVATTFATTKTTAGNA